MRRRWSGAAGVPNTARQQYRAVGKGISCPYFSGRPVLQRRLYRSDKAIKNKNNWMLGFPGSWRNAHVHVTVAGLTWLPDHVLDGPEICCTDLSG
jgi:hypothetical protein